MKKILNLYRISIFIAGCTSAFISYAQQTLLEKSKLYSQSYAVKPGDKVVLDNLFGEMRITTWDKKEIKVDVAVVARAGDDKTIEEIFNGVIVQNGRNDSVIFFKTSLPAKKDSWGDGGNRQKAKNNGRGFSSNYTVYLPKNLSLEASNNFGSVLISDFEGSISLTCKYGTLTTGTLSQSRKITIVACNADIKNISNCDLDISFSRVQISGMSGTIRAKLDQNPGVKLKVDNNLKALDIHSDYSQTFLEVDKKLSASFDITESYGGLDNRSEFAIQKSVMSATDQQKWPGTKKYIGKAGIGMIPITANDNFGTLVLAHSVPFDVNEKIKQ